MSLGPSSDDLMGRRRGVATLIEIERTMIIPLISHARDLGGFFVRRYPRRYPDTIVRTEDATEVRSKSLELLATPAGFEPATFSLEGCCSIP